MNNFKFVIYVNRNSPINPEQNKTLHIFVLILIFIQTLKKIFYYNNINGNSINVHF